MIQTTIKYIVYNHSGSGVRHHHFSTVNNIIDEADGNASPGDHINALGFPTVSLGANTLPFAFMSVHGAADGNHLYTNPGNQIVTVGTTNIDILVVYAPVGGIGSGDGTGVWVDAFNVDTGNFSDSDFIQILTPPTPPDSIDSSKTSHANMEGDVSSVTPENLRAFANVDGAPFVEWKKIYPSANIVTSRDLPLAINETGEIWFAFYQTLPANPSIIKVVKNIETAVAYWVIDDYCGTPPHVGPNGPHFRILIDELTQKALSPAQKEKLHSIAKEYPAVANAAFAAMNKVTTLLHSVNTVLNGGKQIGH